MRASSAASALRSSAAWRSSLGSSTWRRVSSALSAALECAARLGVAEADRAFFPVSRARFDADDLDGDDLDGDDLDGDDLDGGDLGIQLNI